MEEIDLKNFETLAYWWQTIPIVWFILVEEDNLIPPPTTNEEGKKEYIFSGPLLTTIESRSLEIGTIASNAKAHISSVISAPNIQCVAAANTFIKGYQRNLTFGEQAMNIKIESGLSKAPIAFRLHKEFQLFAAESGYNVDGAYKTFAQCSQDSSSSSSECLERRIVATVENIIKIAPISVGSTMVVFVDSSLKSILKRLGLKEEGPMEKRTTSSKAPAENKQEDENKNRINGIYIYILNNENQPNYTIKKLLKLTGSMLSCDLSTFDSWSVRWDVTRELWFILVEDDVLPFLRLSAARNQENVKESEFPSMTESRSRAMGTASQNARFNITDVFSAPSFTCVTAAENFIEGFERGRNDGRNNLTIKVDGGFSQSVDGYYWQKQFRSLAVQRGYRVDEAFESSIKRPGSSIFDPYVNLQWRINAAVESLRTKHSVAMNEMIVVFVEKSLESVLKEAFVGLNAAFKSHVSSVGISVLTPQIEK
ncbi:hypothetical protein T05_6506 [Trichinella murrelli]|uniref:Uncharacterized protein n=1 Tax=Trichinella murrelli TaxID=144512 RepID=A0A0V0U602_9BILA|nr:hypothetical protein T05_6506 [Trichinella murrelli]